VVLWREGLAELVMLTRWVADLLILRTTAAIYHTD